MRILVTGCAGFIGFNLTIKLLKTFPGSKIFGIDNFDKYYSPKLKKNRKNVLIKNKKFFFKKVKYPFWVQIIFSKGIIQQLYHIILCKIFMFKN